MQLKNQKDFFSGLLCAAMGMLFAWAASWYSLGTAQQMGPGYFPLLLGALLTVLGGLVVFKALVFETEDGGRMGSRAWRPVVLALLVHALVGALLGGMDRLGWLGWLQGMTPWTNLSPAFSGSDMVTQLVGRLAPTFGAAQTCALFVLGLACAMQWGAGPLLKSLAMVVLGLLLGLVGTDADSGMLRFGWEIPVLSNGLGIIVLALWAWLPRLPHRNFYPALLLLSALLLLAVLGLYSRSHSMLEIGLLWGFALAGYGFYQLGLSSAPLLSGFVLGPVLESSMRSALQQSQGDWGVFVTRPASVAMLLAALGLLVLMPGRRFGKFANNAARRGYF